VYLHMVFFSFWFCTDHSKVGLQHDSLSMISFKDFCFSFE
jgi:hypothetical protein